MKRKKSLNVWKFMFIGIIVLGAAGIIYHFGSARGHASMFNINNWKSLIRTVPIARLVVTERCNVCKDSDEGINPSVGGTLCSPSMRYWATRMDICGITLPDGSPDFEYPGGRIITHGDALAELSCPAQGKADDFPIITIYHCTCIAPDSSSPAHCVDEPIPFFSS